MDEKVLKDEETLENETVKEEIFEDQTVKDEETVKEETFKDKEKAAVDDLLSVSTVLIPETEDLDLLQDILQDRQQGGHTEDIVPSQVETIAILARTNY